MRSVPTSSARRSRSASRASKAMREDGGNPDTCSRAKPPSAQLDVLEVQPPRVQRQRAAADARLESRRADAARDEPAQRDCEQHAQHDRRRRDPQHPALPPRAPLRRRARRRRRSRRALRRHRAPSAPSARFVSRQHGAPIGQRRERIEARRQLAARREPVGGPHARRGRRVLEEDAVLLHESARAARWSRRTRPPLPAARTGSGRPRPRGAAARPAARAGAAPGWRARRATRRPSARAATRGRRPARRRVDRSRPPSSMRVTSASSVGTSASSARSPHSGASAAPARKDSPSGARSSHAARRRPRRPGAGRTRRRSARPWRRGSRWRRGARCRARRRSRRRARHRPVRRGAARSVSSRPARGCPGCGSGTVSSSSVPSAGSGGCSTTSSRARGAAGDSSSPDGAMSPRASSATVSSSPRETSSHASCRRWPVPRPRSSTAVVSGGSAAGATSATGDAGRGARGVGVGAVRAQRAVEQVGDAEQRMIADVRRDQPRPRGEPRPVGGQHRQRGDTDPQLQRVRTGRRPRSSRCVAARAGQQRAGVVAPGRRQLRRREGRGRRRGAGGERREREDRPPREEYCPPHAQRSNTRGLARSALGARKRAHGPASSATHAPAPPDTRGRSGAARRARSPAGRDPPACGPRDGADLEAHVPVIREQHAEALGAALDVAGQRRVLVAGRARRTGLVEDAPHDAGVREPDAGDAREHRDHAARRGRRVARHDLEPAELDVPPAEQRRARAAKTPRRGRARRGRRRGRSRGGATSGSGSTKLGRASRCRASHAASVASDGSAQAHERRGVPHVHAQLASDPAPGRARLTAASACGSGRDLRARARPARGAARCRRRAKLKQALPCMRARNSARGRPSARRSSRSA